MLVNRRRYPNYSSHSSSYPPVVATGRWDSENNYSTKIKGGANRIQYVGMRLKEFRWHRAVMERWELSCACVEVCGPGNKNDYSTVSITNTGCIRCDY